MKTQKGTQNSLLQKFPVFLPVSPLLIFWYFTVLIIILLDFAFTVIFLCFRSSQAEYALWHAIVPLAVIIMGLDIPITFNTSFIYNGQLILDRKQIAKNYIFSIYFIIDIFAFSIAFIQLILRNAFQDQDSGLNFLIFFKIIKAMQFDKLIKKYVLKSASLILYYQMVKNLILLALLCHTIGSFFFYIDVLMIENDWYTPDRRWVQGSYCFNNIIDLPVGWQYAYAFYYAVVTMSGTAYGDLTPLNQTQTAYTFGSVALPMIVYAYLFSVIYNAISERRNKTIEATKYKKMSKYYFKDLGISRKLTNKLMNYLTYVYQKKISIDNDFLENLAPSIKKQYIRTIIDNNYEYQLFYPLCRPQFDIQNMKQIIYDVIEEQSFPNGYSLSHKTQKIKLFFINRGIIMEIVELKQRKFSKNFKQKNFFMTHPFFTGNYSMRKNNWYEVKQFTICQVIDYHEFMKHVNTHATLKQSYHMLRDRILFQRINIMINIQCFFCESKEHILNQCPKLRLQTDIQKIKNKSLARNQLNYNKFFIRNRKHSRDTKLMSGFQHKLKMNQKLSRNQNIQQNIYSLDNTKSIQTSDNINWKLPIKFQQIFQTIHNWKIFFPTYSYFSNSQ